MTAAMTYEEVDRLLDRLIRATTKNRFTWTADSDYCFSGVLGKATVTISSLDEDDVHPFQFWVTGRAGTLANVESNISEGVVSADLLTRGLEELYRAAKRQALDIDTEVSDLFSTLDSIDPDFS